MTEVFDDSETLLELIEEAGVGSVAERVVHAAAKACGWDAASVMVLYPRRTVDVVGVTDGVVRRLDEAQLELNEGPCLDAVTDRSVVTSADVGADPRWPTWGPMVAREGFPTMLSVRLFTGEQVVGALNAYLTSPRVLETSDVTEAQVHGHRAAMLLTLGMRQEQLRTAVERRHRIGLAQGVLISRYGLDEQSAFEVLRRHARSSGRKLQDVAAEVVERRELSTGHEH